MIKSISNKQQNIIIENKQLNKYMIAKPSWSDC